MDLINTFMNLVVPSASFFTLMMFVPPYYFFKLLLSTLNSIFNTEALAGKVVLITGASSGIGEQLAYQYAMRGASLALVARRESRLQEVAERAKSFGSPDVLVIHGDVTKVDDCRRFIEEAVNHFGQLDHLVNNAGILLISMFEEATNVENFRPIMETNFWGAIYPTHFAIPHLRKSKGKIVVTASSGGILPIPRMSVYNASKAALINFYECLRIEIGSDVGITIVTPGVIESEITQGKFLNKEGAMDVDPETRDVQFGAVPIGYAEGCARRILNGVQRGDKYITEPAWFKALFFWKVFCPDLVEWQTRFMLLTRLGKSRRAMLSKMVLDVTGAKYFLYPTSIQEPETKED